MKKHLIWIPLVALLGAVSAFAAGSPAAPADEGSAPVASGLSCPGGGHGGCGCHGEGECGCGGGCGCHGDGQCNGGQDGSCECGPDCPRFVDEDGDTVCDLRGQGGCNCQHHGP